MPSLVLLPVLGILLATLSEDAHLREACSDFYSEIRKHSLPGMDVNQTFETTQVTPGNSLAVSTSLRFASHSINIPYVGDNEVKLSDSNPEYANRYRGLVVVAHLGKPTVLEKGELAFLGIEDREAEAVAEPIFLEELAYQGFFLTLADLECQAAKSSYIRRMSQLFAKWGFSRGDGAVFQVTGYDAAFVTLDPSARAAELHIVNGQSYLSITLVADTFEVLENWLGVQLSEKR